MLLSSALLVVVLATLVISWCRIKDPDPIFNVYQRPTRWYPFKYAIVIAVLGIRKLYARWGLHRSDGKCSAAGYGFKSKVDVAEMERLQPIRDETPLAVDAVFFCAASKNGCFFEANLARRPNGIADSFWHLKIPSVGLLLSPKQPGTTMTADANAYSADGLFIEPVEPMRLWSIKYDGKMRLDSPEDNLLDVSIQLEWSSELPYFDCDTDMGWRPVARAIAKEPWSQEYFENLKRSHQTHYEQVGYLHGTVKIQGFGEHFLDMNCMRDHSYSHKRDWKLIHRYALHNVTVNDGTKFAAGIISHPDMFSELEFGYLYTPAGKLVSIESCDLKLYRHGEQGTPPTDYAFNFRADGKDYVVQCQVLESPEVYIGPDWEARVLERMCKYRVNGKLGWGFASWEYRHYGGKPIKSEQSSYDNLEDISDSDTDWVSR